MGRAAAGVHYTKGYRKDAGGGSRYRFCFLFVIDPLSDHAANDYRLSRAQAE